MGKVLKLAKEISADQKIVFAINKTDSLPHITLGLGNYKKDELKIMAKKAAAGWLELDRFAEGKGYVMINFKKSSWLKKICMTDWEKYQPHLTLARFKERKTAIEIAYSLNQKARWSKTWVNRIALTEMGLNGTSTKIVKSISLDLGVVSEKIGHEQYRYSSNSIANFV